MTEEMKKIIFANDKHIVVQAYAGCVDKDTEYFNGERWVKISEYKRGDEVLQFNSNWTANLVKPSRYIKQPCTMMYQFKDREVDMVLSEEHRVIYMDERSNIKEILCKDLVEQLPKTPRQKLWIIKPYSAYNLANIYEFAEISAETQIDEIIPTDGMNYCFTVPSGMLILRRNGNIFVTGNCGKSTTMLEYVKAHPTEKILFLVYNKAMSMEFSQKLKGVRHKCDVKTIHSLAYRWYLSKGFPRKKLENMSIVDMAAILKGNLDYVSLSRIKFYYDMFLTSNVKTVDELDLQFKTDVTYLKHVKKLWNYYVSKDSAEMQHNVYLKMFQLAQVKLDYDTIILDECNDSNLCMLDILVANIDKKLIAVGDSFQMINAFNFNTDGLAFLRDDYDFKEYYLTDSFRVSEKVARLSSKYMQYMYDTDKFLFHGLGTTEYGKLHLERADKINQIHLLCRTRLGGLKELVAELFNRGVYDKKLYFVGGLKGFGIDEIKRILEYRGTVYIGGKKFHISELRKMKADGLDDAEINRIISIYDFVNKTPNIIDLLEMSEVKNKKDADIVVLTSHSSKGLTLENVKLCNDFPPLETTKEERKSAIYSYDKALANAECNLLYVAITRATQIFDGGEVFVKQDKRKYEKVDLDY